MKFACFQSIDARQDVGIPVHGVDAVALRCGNEREMNGSSSGALVGARKETILSHKDPAFNCPLGLVVVDCNVGIFEESSQRSPVLESVVNCFHQLVGGIEFAFGIDNDFPKKLDERLRFFAPHSQPKTCRLVLYVPLDFVEIFVHVENCTADLLFGEFRFKVFATGVSAATCFDSLPIFKQGIESAGSICLNDAFEIFEEREIFVKGQVGRKVEHVHWMSGIADVGSYLPFANIVFVSAVLNLDERVVSFDDAGLEQFNFLKVVQQGEGVGGCLHPVALGRAWDVDVVAGEDFLLAIVRKSIVEFTDDYFCEQARTGVASRNGWTGLFGSDDVLLAARASTGLLQMLENFQAGAYHFELVSEHVANGHSFDRALWARNVFRFDRMRHRLMRQMFRIFEDMFDAGCLILPGGISTSIWFGLAESRARVVFLGLLPVVSLVAFFRLSDQDIELGLQVFEQFTQLGIALECFAKLSIQLLEKLCLVLYLLLVVSALLSQSQEFFVIFVRHRAPPVVTPLMIPLPKAS